MGFLGWLLSLLAKLGLDFWLNRGPSRLETETKAAGEAQADLTVAKAENTTVQAEAQAEADAPKSQSAIVTKLRKGDF